MKLNPLLPRDLRSCDAASQFVGPDAAKRRQTGPVLQIAIPRAVVRFLTVPIHVDALALGRRRQVLPPDADFGLLPRTGPETDLNPGRAWLSEEIAPEPFGEDRVTLEAGVHLHWALPDVYHKGRSHGAFAQFRIPHEILPVLDGGALPDMLAGRVPELAGRLAVEVVTPRREWRLVDAATGRSVTARLSGGRSPADLRISLHDDRVVFPPAPNRWLVRRKLGSRQDAWVVESDYLHEPDAGARPGGMAPVAFPVRDAAGGFALHRLGRVLTLEEWAGGGAAPAERCLPSLTAVGWGEPNFAAFYPDCHSVFGFHDAEVVPGRTGGAALSYQVVGWHQAADDDPLESIAWRDASAAVADRYHRSFRGATEAQRAHFEGEALEAAFGWTLPDGEGLAGRRRVALLGAVTVECETPDFARSAERNERQTAATIAVGHSGTEALSAYIGSLSGRGKRVVEDQLEALHLAPKLDKLTIDIGPKFREARHEKEFSPVEGGVHWILVFADDARHPLPPRLAADIEALNVAQAEHDRLADEIADLRRQVYADWCKYMMCAYPALATEGDYPDMDVVRRFIEEVSLPALDRRLAAGAAAQGRVAAAREAVLAGIAAMTPRPELKPRPAPRYWAPNEPVVLIAGESVTPSPRHGEDAGLVCGLPEIEAPRDPDAACLTALAELAAGQGVGGTGHRHCCEQPWHPLFLDWRVEVMPARGGDNIDSARRSYDPGFVEDGFRFDDEGADLEPETDSRHEVRLAENFYAGRSILTPDAGDQLRDALEVWLSRALSPDPEAADFLEACEAALKDRTDVPRIVRDMLATYRDFYGPEGQGAVPFMSQALSGFNHALVMQRQTMQLPVIDPLGFAGDRDFAARVAEAVGDQNRTAPLPLNDFNPIRSGRLRVLALRLVDTFGQVRDIDFDADALIPAHSMTTADAPDLAMLRPRLSQPARLDFRWLAASEPAAAMRDAGVLPDQSALCGWLVHELSTNSLLVKAADGDALGTLTQEGRWLGAPGEPRLSPWQVGNPHLARLVAHLRRDPSLGDFMAGLEAHLDRIVPAAFAEDGVLPLLLGRPLAVVRARLELRLKGLPAVNQDWSVFRHALEYGPQPGRAHDRFDAVRFPVRLGDTGQLDDGLVAIWPEHHHADGRCDCIGAAQVAAESEISLTPGGGPQSVIMLIDPRASVHARSGILPTKAITLPKSNYAEALARMSFAIPVGPILTPEGRLSLFAPETTHFDQAWLSRTEDGWQRTPLDPPPEPGADWSGRTLVREGWIRLTPKAAAPAQDDEPRSPG